MRPPCVNCVGPRPSVLSDMRRTHTWEENGGRPRETAVRRPQDKGRRGRLGMPGTPTSGRRRKAPHPHPERLGTPGPREPVSQPARPRGSALAPGPGPQPPQRPLRGCPATCRPPQPVGIRPSPGGDLWGLISFPSCTDLCPRTFAKKSLNVFVCGSGFPKDRTSRAGKATPGANPRGDLQRPWL